MKKFSKKIMEFLFGTKYPIFNKKGKIQHSRDQFVEEWKTRYKNDPNYDWKNHAGMHFEDSPSSKKISSN